MSYTTTSGVIYIYYIFQCYAAKNEMPFFLDVWGHKIDFMHDWSNTKKCRIREPGIFAY